jgi:hypothetical protein
VVLAIILSAALAYITGKKTPFKDLYFEFEKDFTHIRWVTIFFVVLAIILLAALAYITGKKTPFKE